MKKKYIYIALALTILSGTSIQSSNAQVNYSDILNKYDNDFKNTVSNMIKDSKVLSYGEISNPLYRITDKSEIVEIAEILKGTDLKTIDNAYEIKGYPFFIYGDNFRIGLLDKPRKGKNGKEIYQGTLYTDNGYTVFRTDNFIYEDIIKIISQSNNVSINYDVNPDISMELFRDNDILQSSIEISKNTFARSKSAVLISEKSITDALSVAGLAGYLDAPILATNGNTINSKLAEELKRLHVKDIYIASGKDMISEILVKKFKNMGYNVNLLGGNDRYETSYNIAKMIGGDKYIIASGQNTNDVPSISTYSFENKCPILLSKKDSIDNRYLSLWNRKTEVYIIGGENTISKKVREGLNKNGIESKNISGRDRYETSEKIVKEFYPKATRLLYENDKNTMENIISSSYSVKYKMPILIKSEKEIKNLYNKSFFGLTDNDLFW